jgi:hypothetical protein
MGCTIRRSAMRMNPVLFLAAVLALSPLDGVAGEKQIADVEELAGTWQGWVTRDNGQERATMYVSADGSYRSLTTGGAYTEGKFYLHDGKLLYRSSRTTGAASISEDQGKAVLTVLPADPLYGAGSRAEYERIE